MDKCVFMDRARLLACAALLVCGAASGTSASVPPGTESADIGNPAIRGSVTYQSGVYTIKAAGKDIWDVADQFYFVYVPVTGDVDARVRVASLANTDMWAKAGIMIRESLSADARHASAFATAAAGYAFQRRFDPGAYSEHTSGGSGAPPGWVRLVRTGSRFDAYRSADGQTWTSIGTDTIPMGSTVYIGLAVTSHNAAVSTTAVFDNVFATQPTVPANWPPTVSLTAPASGATATAPATIEMTAAASDPEGRLAGVDFLLDGTLVGTDAAAPFSMTVSAVPAGSHEVTAIARDLDGASTESAPVVVTVASAGTTPFYGTSIALPGTLQAEDFDRGVDGVAYHDTTPVNEGGAYRTTGVDIAAAYDTGGGYTLGWVGAGEWLKYSVTVAAAGRYDLEVRVASAYAGGTFHIEANGVDITGPLTVPNTGGWQTWKTIRAAGVSLVAGAQVWRLVMDTNGATGVGNFNYVRVTSAPVEGTAPFHGTAVALPGTLQAEDFDQGAAGAAYQDTTPTNEGGEYRPTTGVDIAAAADTGGGYTLGWVRAGEWLRYSVTVAAAGAYDLEVRVACAAAGGTFHIEANGVDITGPLTVPNTGGWQSWTTVRKTGVSLAAGPQVWRLVMDSTAGTSIGNFNWIRLSSGAGPAPLPRAVAFTASADHADLVTSYVLRVFVEGANPAADAPFASSDLGKPTPDASGEISVERSSFFSALPAGSYVAVVSAVGTEGEALSGGVAFNR